MNIEDKDLLGPLMEDLIIEDEGNVPEQSEEEGSADVDTSEDTESTQDTEHPSDDNLYANKFKTIGALAKGLGELSRELGDSIDLNELETPEEMEEAYLEAQRRYSGRKKTTTTQTQPEDDRYTQLQQQVAQTQQIITELVPALLRQRQEPESAPEPKISEEDQRFLEEMEEIYPGFGDRMQNMIAETVQKRIAPVEQLASQYQQQAQFVQGWQAVAQRNPDFKDLLPEIKEVTTKLPQEEPQVFAALQNSPEALYSYVYTKVKAMQAGDINNRVSQEVTNAAARAAEEKARLEAEKQGAGMPKPGARKPQKPKTMAQQIQEEILNMAGGGGIVDGLL